MARKAVGAVIQGKVSIDLSHFEKALAALEKAVREEMVDKALFAGGKIIQGEASSRAPGPNIVVEKMSGSKLGKGTGTLGEKAGVNQGGAYVVIGPDRAHWFYLFREFGVKTHGVGKRKRTRYRQFVGKKSGMLPKYRELKPAMRLSINGEIKFAKVVRGFSSKPFMKPAAMNGGPAAVRVIAKTLVADMENIRT